MSRTPSGTTSRTVVLVMLAGAAIVLTAATLRIAVASFSPLLSRIQGDIPLSSVVTGLIGAAPPLAYAVFGILTPALARRFRLETLALAVVVVTGGGLVGRALSTEPVGLVGFTALAFSAIGVGNVLLPGLVKKYFPERIGLMTTIYISTLSLATIVPPLVEVPLSDAAGWRLALGVWAGVAGVAILPWAALLVRGTDVDATDVEEPAQGMLRRVLGLPRTWALIVGMVLTSATAYSAFAWLPLLLADQAGVDALGGGALLAVFAGMGLVFSLFAPAVVVRLGFVRTLFGASIVLGIGGVLGLLLVPRAAPLAWVVLLSLPTLLFPVVFTLIGIKTRTHTTTVALSSAVQSIGYAICAVFPLAVGVLHQATGGWAASLVLLGAMIAAGVFAIRPVSRPGTIEDDWEARTGRSW